MARKVLYYSLVSKNFISEEAAKGIAQEELAEGNLGFITDRVHEYGLDQMHMPDVRLVRFEIKVENL